MPDLLIFTVVCVIGILLIFTIARQRKWKFVITFLLIGIGILLLVGFRFTASGALPMGSNVIRSIDTAYGKAILYEDQTDDTFGLAKIKKHLALLYHHSGGTSDAYYDGSSPFKAAGYGSGEEDGFLVGVKTGVPNIKYIVIGNHLEDITEEDAQNVNMKVIEKYPDSYHVEEVVENYAFFVLDRYSEATWTIRALDVNGSLVADKLFGAGEARFVD